MMRDWLLNIRKKQNKTQQEVADKALISRVYYTRIENGEFRVPVKTAIKIADVLGFSWTLFYSYLNKLYLSTINK